MAAQGTPTELLQRALGRLHSPLASARARVGTWLGVKPSQTSPDGADSEAAEVDEAMGHWRGAQADFEKAWFASGLSVRASTERCFAVQQVLDADWSAQPGRRQLTKLLFDITGPFAVTMRMGANGPAQLPADALQPAQHAQLAEMVVAMASHVVAHQLISGEGAELRIARAAALSEVLREWVDGSILDRSKAELVRLDQLQAAGTESSSTSQGPDPKRVPELMLADAARDIGGGPMRRLSIVAPVVGPLKLLEIASRFPTEVLKNNRIAKVDAELQRVAERHYG